MAEEKTQINASIIHSCDRGAIVRVHDWGLSWMARQHGRIMPHCLLRGNGCESFFCDCKCSLCRE